MFNDECKWCTIKFNVIVSNENKFILGSGRTLLWVKVFFFFLLFVVLLVKECVKARSSHTIAVFN